MTVTRILAWLVTQEGVEGGKSVHTRVVNNPRLLLRQSSGAMQRAAKIFFQQGKDTEFARAAKLMEEINRFRKALEQGGQKTQ